MKDKVVIFYFLRCITGIVCSTLLSIHFNKWYLIFISLIFMVGININLGDE